SLAMTDAATGPTLLAQYAHDAGYAVHGGLGAAHGFDDADLGVLLLTRARFAPELPYYLGRLKEARRPYGMAPRKEAAAGVNRDAARVYPGASILYELCALPFSAETECLVDYHLGYREGVV